MKIDFRLTDDQNPRSVRVINTSRKDNLLFYSFSIVNCIDGWIELTWSSSASTFSLWGQRINILFTHLSCIDGFSYEDSNTIYSNYNMYTLANIGKNAEPIANPSPGC